jgi:hypothetical protein
MRLCPVHEGREHDQLQLEGLSGLPPTCCSTLNGCGWEQGKPMRRTFTAARYGGDRPERL